MERGVDIVLAPGVAELARALDAHGHDALLVGGVVRDALLGACSVDWDIVTMATPDDVRLLAPELTHVRRVYELGERFGTVGVALEDGRLEISRYRPDALRGGDIEERFALDARHRDFTINAMALDLVSGALLDPLGGVQDLDARILRAPHPASERFGEDPLRILRGARFVAELGFSLTSDTADAMPEYAPALDRVAVERIREELGKLLVAPHPAAGLRVLLESGALAVVLPEVAALDGVSQPSFHDLDVLEHTLQTVELTPATPVLRWAALLHDVGKAPTRSVEEDGRIRFFRHAQEGARIAEQICLRLRMSAADTGAIVHLVAEHMRLGDVNFDNPRSVDRAVRKLDLPVPGSERRLVTAEDALELTMADFSATAHRDEAPQLRERLESVLRESRERGTSEHTRSPLSGAELMHALSLPEGKAVGIAKAAIIEAIEAGALDPNDAAGALAVARRAVQQD